jgi:hypothetical protein
MSRALRCFLPLDGDAEGLAARFLDDPGSWLPDARHVGPDRWQLSLRAGPVERPVELTVGHPWHVGRTWWRTCAWRPLPAEGEPLPVARLLPVLDGELGLSVRTGHRLTLVLDGRYQPPGGRVGDAIDAVALNRVARGSVDQLLIDVAARLRLPEPARH